MKRVVWNRCVIACVSLGLGGATAFGQTVYVAKSATGAPPTSPQTITATAGDVLTLEVWVSNIPSAKSKEFRATMPCGATRVSGFGGSIDYPAGTSPTVNDGDGAANSPADPDYLFAGRSVPAPIKASRVGKCSAATIDNYPSITRGYLSANAVGPFSVPKYLATFTYNVSADAEGTFTVQAQLDSPPACPGGFGSYLLSGAVTTTCLPITFVPITINVPSPGKCCATGGCALPVCSDGVTRAACGGAFTPFATCGGSPTCPCTTGSNCSDGLACTKDVCTAGVCSNPSIPVLYADIYPCGGDGFINALDIWAMSAIYNGTWACPACNGIAGCSGRPADGGGAGDFAPPAAQESESETAKASYLSPARITLSADAAVSSQGKLIKVDVYAGGVAKLRSYHLGVEVTGGVSGDLELESISVDRQRPDYAFPGQNSVVLLVDEDRKTLDVIHLDKEVTPDGPVYLGTFSFRPSADARGKFQVNVRPQDGATLTGFRDRIVVPEQSTAATISIR